MGALSKLSGLTSRTIRHYDAIGLLKPLRTGENGYRVYGQKQVDDLQQIMLYRALGMPLEQIALLLADPTFDRGKALKAHLGELRRQKDDLEKLIVNVRKTIKQLEEGTYMADSEKFEGFKREIVRENEARYGAEARKLFGDKAVDDANEKLLKRTKADFDSQQALEAELNETLKKACATKDPASKEAQAACQLHALWIEWYWPEGTYTKEAHRQLAQGYVDDPRFTAYYEKIAPGCAVFLRDALNIYCAE